MTDNILDKTPWESCGIQLFRFKVDGGYLYARDNYNGSALCFVPDASNSQPNVSQEGELTIKDIAAGHDELSMDCYEGLDELKNTVADLSMKINKMQSDMCEFEKQKVEPIEQLCESNWKDLHDCIRIHSPLWKDTTNRIEKLESLTAQSCDQFYHESLSSHDCRINHIFEHLEKLEYKVAMCENSDIQECKMVRKFIHELDERLEKLESLHEDNENVK